MKAVIATTTGFHLRRLAVELTDARHDVEYFSYVPRFRTRRQGIDPDTTTSLFIRLLPTSAHAQVAGAPHQMRAVERLLAKTDEAVARRLPPSDVFIGLSSMAVASAARARDLGAQVIIDRGSRHVASQDRLIRADGGSGLTEHYVGRELASYRAADYICVPSTHAAESFYDEGFAPERIFTCPLGVDLDQFAPTTRPAGRPRLLFVGGWSHQKGVDVLVEALARRTDWELTHVGTTTGDHPPGDRITSLGTKSHAELSALMRDHHVLVLPSRQDGFGMVLLEALASGVPVVASRLTGGPDIQDALSRPDWVEIVEPGDVDDLVRGLDAMLHRQAIDLDDGPREILTSTDREHFSWRGYGRRYGQFLASIAASEESA